MEFTNSQHFVLSYDLMFTADIHFKVETYYQDITHVPVEQMSSSFSMLNAGADFSPVDNDYLINEGTGRNLGVEVTLEKFYSDGYYFLLTTSLFDSKYKGSDGVQRSTAFDGGYIVNLLGGKEFKVGKKNNTFNIDLKLTTSSGNPYTPIDLEQSAALGTEVRKDNEAYSLRLDNYLRADVKLSYRINRPKLTHEFAIDLQNITNNQNVFAQTYNARTNEVNTQYQIGFFPIPQYRITF
jgi:hypothetical protein